MKRNPSVTNHKNSEKYSDKLLSWEELFEKGTLLRNTITLEANSDFFCPKTGKRITPGQCTKENMDFLCVPAGNDID